MKLFSVLCFTLSFTPNVFAANLPAKNCEIFIQDLTAKPGSHGSAETMINVKVKYFGNGELVRRVGFYSTQSTLDLGNGQSCSWNVSAGQTSWKIIDGARGAAEGNSIFVLGIQTGSVSSLCGGYDFATEGAFFVETNFNTYWLNPNMDSNQYFTFDQNGFNFLNQRGAYQAISTSRADMKYFNPAACR
jgi:hypothetical protein